MPAGIKMALSLTEMDQFRRLVDFAQANAVGHFSAWQAARAETAE